MTLSPAIAGALPKGEPYIRLLEDAKFAWLFL